MDHWQKIGYLPAAQIRDLQNKKLCVFINRYLYPFSPYYRNLFDKNKIAPEKIKTISDLENIPFTSKHNFVDFPDGSAAAHIKQFILQPDIEKIKRAWPINELLRLKFLSIFKGSQYVQEILEEEFRPVFITFTTGTTQKPISYLYTKYDIGNLHLSGARMVNLFDIKKSDHLVSFFPFAPHLAFWQVVFGGLSATVLIMSTGGGKVMGTGGNIAILEKMKPSVIIGVPSYVYHVLRAAKEQGCRLDFVKKVVLGAAKAPIAFKVKLAELLECMGAREVSVFGTYGFTEARCAWAECPTTNDLSSGYHLYPDKEIFEIIDPDTGKVKKEGEDGELVYTSIDSRGSSVLRYRTGDFVKGGIVYEPCPHCRRTVPRISNDISRISDVQDIQISKVKGALVNFGNFSEVFAGFKEIEEWQIELCKKDNDPFEVDQLMVYICPREGVNREALTDAIQRQLLLKTEVSANTVNFIPLPEMIRRLELETSNKEKRILDRRPK